MSTGRPQASGSPRRVSGAVADGGVVRTHRHADARPMASCAAQPMSLSDPSLACERLSGSGNTMRGREAAHIPARRRECQTRHWRVSMRRRQRAGSDACGRQSRVRRRGGSARVTLNSPTRAARRGRRARGSALGRVDVARRGDDGLAARSRRSHTPDARTDSIVLRAEGGSHR